MLEQEPPTIDEFGRLKGLSQVIVKKRMPILVRDEGEAQAGVTVESGLFERIDGNDTVAADPHLGGTSATDHTGFVL